MLRKCVYKRIILDQKNKKMIYAIDSKGCASPMGNADAGWRSLLGEEEEKCCKIADSLWRSAARC